MQAVLIHYLYLYLKFLLYSLNGINGITCSSAVFRLFIIVEIILGFLEQFSKPYI
jgi:hypothetical protein